ncbi:CheR family methyltransferase [Alicyclobacillus fodiniaquatilis]|uniref:protein-glutamate O-methyltransferase n=1 Tax=Alicyclobacillus fodiniaquatilis TaxID=1661150 RepID=A0ABW4JMR9_9BACL
MDEYLWFVTSFYQLSGIDLGQYKRPQMERRLTNIRNRRGYEHFSNYFAALQQNKSLMDELLDKMTINVSEFFRNPDRWAQVRKLLVERGVKHPLRAWSAACATGEEPYSLAILLEEAGLQYDEIMATDIDLRVLESAKKGIFEKRSVANLSDTVLNSYFTVSDSKYIIRPSLKKHVAFSQHNLLSDAYPNTLDIIVCRNVLIYFTKDAKQMILGKFSTSLRPGGLLFVGSTEQLMGFMVPSLKLVAPFIYEKQA